MKTSFSLYRFILPSAILIGIASCSKDVTTSPNDQSLQNLPTNSANGVIIDQGPVAQGIHRMQLTISDLRNVNGSANGDPFLNINQVTTRLYTDADGLIRPGLYNYATADAIKPFTFDEGSVMISGNTKSSQIVTQNVTDGMINISYDSDAYRISVSFVLDNADTLYGNAVVYMEYNDDW